MNRRTPIECECKKCGYKWGANSYNLAYKGTGCPACPSKEKFKMSFEKKFKIYKIILVLKYLILIKNYILMMLGILK